MIFQRILRTNPEKIFIVAYNTLTTALSNGQAVSWDYLAEYDGVSVTKPPATAVGAGFTFAGVAAETIAAGSYGLIQVYGYHSATRVRAASTSGKGATKAVASGTPLMMSQASAYCLEALFTASTTKYLHYPAGFAFAANAEYTTAAIAVFIKAL